MGGRINLGTRSRLPHHVQTLMRDDSLLFQDGSYEFGLVHRLDIPSSEIVQVQGVLVALVQSVLLEFRHHA